MTRVFYPVSAAERYATCRNHGGEAFLARTFEEACEHAANDALPDWKPRPKRRFWIGAGSNTWKSDLKLDVVYEKTEGPAGRPGATLGIPWMVGIPGTIGGWIKMNAGAHGHSISEVVRAVKVDGRWIARKDCGFRYRGSSIEGEIQDVKWKMESGKWKVERGKWKVERGKWKMERGKGKGEEWGTAAEYLKRRRKFPAGTKGSVFKNPEGDSAGRLLEQAGCKGLRVGGAYVWQEHANVIVSGPGANNSDFLALAWIMRQRVIEKFGVTLEPEVRGLDFE